MSNRPRVCALDGCAERFVPPKRAPHKRYCCERHQRIAEKRRYRQTHTEWAACKGCGRRFERSATSPRLQVYCTADCQAESRSVEYANRPDILAGLARAREAWAATEHRPEPSWHLTDWEPTDGPLAEVDELARRRRR